MWASRVAGGGKKRIIKSDGKTGKGKKKVGWTVSFFFLNVIHCIMEKWRVGTIWGPLVELHSVQRQRRRRRRLRRRRWRMGPASHWTASLVIFIFIFLFLINHPATEAACSGCSRSLSLSVYPSWGKNNFWLPWMTHTSFFLSLPLAPWSHHRLFEAAVKTQEEGLHNQQRVEGRREPLLF